MLIDLIRDATIRRSYGQAGISLSGGLDSSTVSVCAPAEMPTFTGWYDVAGFDERGYARLVAHARHYEVRITPEDFVEHFDAFAAVVADRQWGTGAFGQYMVARYAANYVDVLLSGEGSDELFGGYARQMIVAGERPPTGYEQYQLPKNYPTTLKEALAYDLDRLPDLLAVDDAMTGAFGIEARAPFTDERIRDYALALPVHERVGKRHLRAAVRGYVPDRIIDRRDKMGFPTPFVLWAQHEPVRSFVEGRIGYVPDALKLWDRGWWLELLSVSKSLAAR